MNIPNFLTSLRIFLIPILIVIYYLPWEGRFYSIAAIFGIAAITDWLDGFLARALNHSTPFGAFFDPVADKVMVCAALVALSEHYQSLYMTIPALIIISREIVISALREWMAEQGKRGNVAVSDMGKLKTAAQMLAIIGLIWQYDSWMMYLSYGLLYIATFLTLSSMVQYLVAAWGELTKN